MKVPRAARTSSAVMARGKRVEFTTGLNSGMVRADGMGLFSFPLHVFVTNKLNSKGLGVRVQTNAFAAAVSHRSRGFVGESRASGPCGGGAR
jgi:hypothetical protein